MPAWLLVAAAASIAIYVVLVGVLVIAGRRDDARALAGLIPDLVVLVRRLLADPRIERRHKLVLGLLIAYLALPFDLVPDFIPIAGQLDDAILVALALRYVLRGAGPGLLAEHWPGPANTRGLLIRLAFGGPTNAGRRFLPTTRAGGSRPARRVRSRRRSRRRRWP